ncbi:PEP-CTERM sorting domain-containing protein [Undibacterium sp.]|uniref:PEP-CTERM sorting domain-containing protein n=1 Tax=Undibacterium sp. TaxID=1914977 RepID=UPI00374C9819
MKTIVGIAALMFGHLLLFAAPVYAAVIVYQDPALFQAVAPNGVTETYEGYAPPGGIADISNTTQGNITYGFNSYVIDPAALGGGYNFNTGAVLTLTNPPGFDPTLSFAPTFALSVLLGTIDQYGQDVLVTINDESFLLPTADYPNLTFYGFVSDTAFTSITFSSFGVDGQGNPINFGFPILDNVFIATDVASVPEPASLAILGLGLLIMTAERRRRQLKQTTQPRQISSLT